MSKKNKSETKPEQAKQHRPLGVIQQEYTQLCAKLGHLSYQIHTLSKEAELVTGTMQELNLEAAAAGAAEAQAKLTAAKEGSEKQEVKQ